MLSTPTLDPNFTITEISKCVRKVQYEEGYDLPDACYEEWLKLNHPQAVSRSLFPDAQL